VADVVLTNDRDLAALVRAADDALARVCEYAGVALARYPAVSPSS